MLQQGSSSRILIKVCFLRTCACPRRDQLRCGLWCHTQQFRPRQLRKSPKRRSWVVFVAQGVHQT